MDTIIKIKNLNFSYSKTGNKVLDNINLSIKRGEIFGIIGPTGAGKSTFMLHLNAILKGEGEVLIDDILIGKKTEKQVREKVGIVFQNPDNQLFCPTVFEDIAFGLFNSGFNKEEVKIKVDQILKKHDLTRLRDTSSHHLSYGEKKRISLACILAMEPLILCFDEPFANLDYKTIFSLIEKIKQQNITRIIISQDILLALSICDRIAVMNSGKILSIDKPANLIKNTELLRQNHIDFTPYLNIIKKISSNPDPI